MKISISINMQKLELLGGVDMGFAALKEAGFEAIEFAIDPTDLSWEEIGAGKESAVFTDENLAKIANELKAASEKHGIALAQCHAPAPVFVSGKPEGTAQMRKNVAKVLDFCGECGIPHVVIHPSFDGSARFPKLTKEDEIAENINYYSLIIPLLKKNHLTCCLENMFSQDWKTKKIYTACCSDMRDSVYYIDTLNEMAGEKCFGFCLDIGHLLLLGLDAMNAMTTLGDRMVALHIHDNDGVDDHHIEPFSGVTNWQRFIKGLRTVGYKGNLNFELGGSWTKIPPELVPAMLRYVAEEGKYFRGKVLAE